MNSITVQNLAELKELNTINGMYVWMLGQSESGDSAPVLYQYNFGSSATANNTTVVAPNSGTGRFLSVTTTGFAPSGRVEVYSGVTDANGELDVSFGADYAAAPAVFVEIVNPDVNWFSRVTAIAVDGCTVHVFEREADTDSLAFATVNVQSATVNVLVVEK